jgi:hypothetical protein
MADQNFARTKSIGMLNQSLNMLEYLARRPELRRLDVLSNSSLKERLRIPPKTPVHVCDTAIKSLAGRVYWGLFGAYSASQRIGNEWLFLPKGFASFARRCPVKLLSCIADTHLEYYKIHFPKAVPLHTRIYDHYSTKAAIQDSTIVYTNSEFTRQEVLRFARKYHLKTPRVRAIGIGFFPKTSGELAKKKRILLLASPWPHKRTDLAVRYMDGWQERTRFDGTVEWVGRFPENLELPKRSNWIFHARLPDAGFYRLMSESTALVYLSGYEGFGMPPVEAVIAGTAPIYSDLEATREVMGEAGYRFDNESYESFESALNQSLETPAETIECWGRELLARYNCEAVVARIIDEIERTQEAGGGS